MYSDPDSAGVYSCASNMRLIFASPPGVIHTGAEGLLLRTGLMFAVSYYSLRVGIIIQHTQQTTLYSAQSQHLRLTAGVNSHWGNYATNHILGVKHPVLEIHWADVEGVSAAALYLIPSAPTRDTRTIAKYTCGS